MYLRFAFSWKIVLWNGLRFFSGLRLQSQLLRHGLWHPAENLKGTGDSGSFYLAMPSGLYGAFMIMQMRLYSFKFAWQV